MGMNLNEPTCRLNSSYATAKIAWISINLHFVKLTEECRLFWKTSDG